MLHKIKNVDLQERNEDKMVDLDEAKIVFHQLVAPQGLVNRRFFFTFALSRHGKINVFFFVRSV